MHLIAAPLQQHLATQHILGATKQMLGGLLLSMLLLLLLLPAGVARWVLWL
jgi:hypothetical protein